MYENDFQNILNLWFSPLIVRVLLTKDKGSKGHTLNTESVKTLSHMGVGQRLEGTKVRKKRKV